MYLIYPYSDRYPRKIFKYYFNLKMNEYAHIWTTNLVFLSTVVAQSVNALQSTFTAA